MQLPLNKVEKNQAEEIHHPLQKQTVPKMNHTEKHQYLVMLVHKKHTSLIHSTNYAENLPSMSSRPMGSANYESFPGSAEIMAMWDSPPEM